jgi:hypothetical protein
MPPPLPAPSLPLSLFHIFLSLSPLSPSHGSRWRGSEWAGHGGGTPGQADPHRLRRPLGLSTCATPVRVLSARPAGASSGAREAGGGTGPLAADTVPPKASQVGGGATRTAGVVLGKIPDTHYPYPNYPNPNYPSPRYPISSSDSDCDYPKLG